MKVRIYDNGESIWAIGEKGEELIRRDSKMTWDNLDEAVETRCCVYNLFESEGAEIELIILPDPEDLN